MTSRAITSEVFDATETSDATEVSEVAEVFDSTEAFDSTEVFDATVVTPFCTISKEGNVDLEVVIAAARLPLDAGVFQFVTVAVEATFQIVEVKTSPDGATAGSGVDSDQSKTVAVDVSHSVAVRTAFTTDDDSWASAWAYLDSMNLENFSTGAWTCPSAICTTGIPVQ